MAYNGVFLFGVFYISHQLSSANKIRFDVFPMKACRISESRYQINRINSWRQQNLFLEGFNFHKRGKAQIRRIWAQTSDACDAVWSDWAIFYFLVRIFLPKRA